MTYVRTDMKVEIVISTFKNSLNSSYGSLTLYDGDSMTDPMIGEYCGQSFPPSSISSRNEIFIFFQSNCCGNNIGFKLEYHPHGKLYIFK